MLCGRLETSERSIKGSRSDLAFFPVCFPLVLAQVGSLVLLGCLYSSWLAGLFFLF